MTNPHASATASHRHDLIVVGGGIYGVCVTLEAARRGLRPLLLERGRVGAATSANSQRVIHGGLRYLQSLDVGRVRESAHERRWFLEHFPDLVQPLTCLMPLYGDGLRRPSTFGMALRLYRLLSGKRDHGQVLSPEQTRQWFPAVDREGLRGGGLWQDALMLDADALLHELLRWAQACGAEVREQAPAESLLTEGGQVRGVRAGGVEHEAPVVINCAGPWCREVARRFDRDVPALKWPSLAFCVLLEREPVSEAAVAVAPRRQGGRTYFLTPWKGRTLAGTYHAPWSGDVDRPAPTSEQLDDLLNDLNAAVPTLGVKRSQVLYVFAGLVPTDAQGAAEPATQAVVVRHGAQGLVSVNGVKYTTARAVAQRVVLDVFGPRPYQRDSDRPARSGQRRPPNDAEAALQASEAPT